MTFSIIVGVAFCHPDPVFDTVTFRILISKPFFIPLPNSFTDCNPFLVHFSNVNPHVNPTPIDNVQPDTNLNTNAIFNTVLNCVCIPTTLSDSHAIPIPITIRVSIPIRDPLPVSLPFAVPVTLSFSFAVPVRIFNTQCIEFPIPVPVPFCIPIAIAIAIAILVRFHISFNICVSDFIGVSITDHLFIFDSVLHPVRNLQSVSIVDHVMELVCYPNLFPNTLWNRHTLCYRHSNLFCNVHLISDPDPKPHFILHPVSVYILIPVSNPVRIPVSIHNYHPIAISNLFAILVYIILCHIIPKPLIDANALAVCQPNVQHDYHTHPVRDFHIHTNTHVNPQQHYDLITHPI